MALVHETMSVTFIFGIVIFVPLYPGDLLRFSGHVCRGVSREGGCRPQHADCPGYHGDCVGSIKERQ